LLRTTTRTRRGKNIPPVLNFKRPCSKYLIVIFAKTSSSDVHTPDRTLCSGGLVKSGMPLGLHSRSDIIKILLKRVGSTARNEYRMSYISHSTRIDTKGNSGVLIPAA
jgi:hypothetical protein